jgi:hypothetical protein
MVPCRLDIADGLLVGALLGGEPQEDPREQSHLGVGHRGHVRGVRCGRAVDSRLAAGSYPRNSSYAAFRASRWYGYPSPWRNSPKRPVSESGTLNPASTRPKSAP